MKKSILSGILLAFVVIIVAETSFAYTDVTPEEAFQMIEDYDNVFIIDVRTPEEWAWVGHPGPNTIGEGAVLSNRIFNIAYKIGRPGAMSINPSFLTDVAELYEYIVFVLGISDPIFITMCRSGVRSVDAAILMDETYEVYNMVTGFEGGKDSRGYRTVNGWVVDGLPYNNSSSGMYSD